MYKFSLSIIPLIFSIIASSCSKENFNVKVRDDTISKEKTGFIKPDFCNKLDCPEYVTISKEGNIEIREYFESYWISTKVKEENYTPEFNDLFDYIKGENERKEKMKMTSPVLRQINATIPFTSDENLSKMSFFLGYKYQNEQAPKPLNENIVIEKIEAKIVAVISYSQHSDKKKEKENLIKLGDYLNKIRAKFNTDFYYIAGYDSPFKLLFRHNEIWVDLIID